MRESVERSIGDLLDSARRTAEETQAIDAAFQDRVRRNYDMLSEAVRLMGVVAGAAGGAPRAAAPRPAAQPAAAALVHSRRRSASGVSAGFAAPDASAQ